MSQKLKDKLYLKGKWKFTIRDEKTGKIKRVYEYDNIIPLVARTMIANNLVATAPDNVMRIKHVALGTGVTAPAAGDTKLQTETYRNEVASEVNEDNVGYVSGFFTAAECNGTYKEAGLFADSTGVADSGILVSHVAINITKANTETLTIDWILTVS